MKFSMKKGINFFWIAGIFLPAINVTVFSLSRDFIFDYHEFYFSNEEEYAEEIKSLGFEDSGADVNIGCFSEKQKFRMKVTDEFEPEDLGEFIEDLRLGKVMPYMKSLPVPKSQEGQQVLKLVANNYDKEVHRQT